MSTRCGGRRLIEMEREPTASARSKLICGADRGILERVKEVVCHRSLLCSWAMGIANNCVR